MDKAHYIRVEPAVTTDEFYTEMSASKQCKSNLVSNRDIFSLLGEQKELEKEQKFVLDEAAKENHV